MMIVKSIASFIHLIILLSLIIHDIDASLPSTDDFDSFQELLFDKTECEEFISDDEWLTVALRNCKPFTCDFPFELCRRPATRYQDEASNTCRKIPDDCLTAINEGKPLTTMPPSTVAVIEESNSLSSTTASLVSTEWSSTPSSPNILVDGSTETVGTTADICNMDQPQGRFCGFQIKVAYNRENQRCEQFWFPGCKTTETNQNLFDSVEDCENATYICKGTGIFVPFFTTHQLPTSVAVVTPSPPLPLVAPFLQTTLEPEFVISQSTTLEPIEPTEAPIARPLRSKLRGSENSKEVVYPGNGFIGPQPLLPRPPVQQRRFISPPGSSMILSLISNGISQFTGAGWEGSGTGGDGTVGNIFSQIPQLIRSLQVG